MSPPKHSFAFRFARATVQAIFHLYEKVADIRDGLMAYWRGVNDRREFIRVGDCKMQGICCTRVGMQVPTLWLRWPRLLRTLHRWHYLRYNFTFVGQKDNIIVYSCGYLQRNNTCGIHRLKPKLCRDYPPKPWRGKAGLHKGCGYSYRYSPVLSFQEKLARARHEARTQPLVFHPPKKAENTAEKASAEIREKDTV